MPYLPLILIIICCLAVIIFVIKRKIVNLDEVAGEISPKQKIDEVKKRLIESKLRKKLAKLGEIIIIKIRLGSNIILSLIHKIRSAQKARPNKLEKARIVETKTESIGELTDAQVLLRQRKLEEAEKKFISALKTDIKNIDAYIGLGEVYAAKKDWQTAAETYEHVIKINPKYLLAYKELIAVLAVLKKWNEVRLYAEKARDFGFKEAWIYAGLGLCCRRTGYPEKAEEWYLKAVEIEPGNEQYLDCLMEASIMNKNRALAHKTFNTLRQMSQNEMKLQDYRNKIEIL